MQTCKYFTNCSAHSVWQTGLNDSAEPELNGMANTFNLSSYKLKSCSHFTESIQYKSNVCKQKGNNIYKKNSFTKLRQNKSTVKKNLYTIICIL